MANKTQRIDERYQIRKGPNGTLLVSQDGVKWLTPAAAGIATEAYADQVGVATLAAANLYTDAGVQEAKEYTDDQIDIAKAEMQNYTDDEIAELHGVINADLANKADLVGGRVPASQLPGFADTMEVYPTFADFPAVGEDTIIYIAEDTEFAYRWNGVAYSRIGEGVLLGETSSTAHRGDHGVIAYNHTSRTDNPHSVSKSQVGLSNVDNTSDLAKPVSTATQTALNGKANTVHTHAIADTTGLQAALDLKANTASLADVATSGDYADLINTPAPLDISGKVSRTGDTMSGTLGMGTNKITDLAAGTAGTDAVNKGQMDAAIAAGGGGSYTFSEGLTESGGDVIAGGEITSATGAVYTSTYAEPAFGVTSQDSQLSILKGPFLLHGTSSLTADAGGGDSVEASSLTLIGDNGFVYQQTKDLSGANPYSTDVELLAGAGTILLSSNSSDPLMGDIVLRSNHILANSAIGGAFIATKDDHVVTKKFFDNNTNPNSLSGNIANTQLAVGSGADTVGGSGNLVYTSDRLGILADMATPTHTVTLGSASTGIAQYRTVDQTTNYSRVRSYWDGATFVTASEQAGSGATSNIGFRSVNATVQVNSSNTASGYLSISGTTTIGQGVGLRVAPTFTSSIGTVLATSIRPTINQSSTGGYTALDIDVNETSTGSGQKSLIQAAVGGSTKFRVDRTGATTIGAYTLPVADGANGQVLKTNGSGAVSWGAGASVTNVTVNTTGSTSAKIGTTTSGTYIPTAGDVVEVLFVDGQAAINVTLAIDGGPAIPLFLGYASAGPSVLYTTANESVRLFYANSKWNMFGPTANTTYLEIPEAEIINPSSTSNRLLTGRRAEYLMANEATKARTLTNKKVVSRVSSSASSGTLTPAVDSFDLYAETAISGTLTIAAPTGAIVDGTKLMFRLKDDGTSRTIVWGPAYRNVGVLAPTATIPNKTAYIGAVYNASSAKWDIIALAQEF